MFDWAKSLFRRGKRPVNLSEQNERLEQEITGRLLSNLQQQLQENNSGAPNMLFWNSLIDPTEPIWDQTDFWLPLGFPQSVPWTLNNQLRGEVLPVYINEYGLKVIRDWSRRILAFNEFALNAVENRISYIVGKGFQYKAVPVKKPKSQTQDFDPQSASASNDALCQRVQAVIDEFVDRARWGEREQECVRRCDRDGEAFIRFFHTGQGRTAVRFIEPELVTEQDGGQIHRQYGIVTFPSDVEDVIAYSVVENPNDGWVTTDIDADDVVHIKLNTDSDSKRGLPTLFPVRKNLERADKLLRNMSTLAQVQATFAVIRKHKQFGQSSVQTYQQNQGDQQLTLPVTGRALQMQQLFPGSILDTSDKTEYEFPSAKVDAGGLVQVLQAELRAVAARLCMPEYMLTVDASNANYASTLVAAAPAVKNFERLQAFYARRFGDGQYGRNGLKHCGVMWRVIHNAVEYGRLPREALTEVEIQVEGPSLVAVDKSSETNRAKVLNEKGILSKPTWAKWEGLDFEQEQAQGAEESAPQPPGGPGGFPPGGGGEESPGSAPPGSAGGEPEDFFGSESVLSFALREEGFTGTITDKAGRKVQFVNGHRVKGGAAATTGAQARKKGSAIHAAHSELVAKVQKQLASDVAAMEKTPEGREALKRGAALSEKIKGKIASGVKAALAAVDAETKGGLSLLAAGAHGRDVGAVSAGVGSLFGAVFQCVHEEVFENALSQHSIPGAHAVGMVAASVAVKAEGALLKAVSWAMAKITGAKEEMDWTLIEAEGGITEADKELLEHLARVAAGAIQEILAEAGVKDAEVSTGAAAKRILTLLKGVQSSRPFDGQEQVAQEGWITLSSKDKEGERHGSTRVFIGPGGHIEKGPGHMVGKKVGDVRIL